MALHVHFSPLQKLNLLSSLLPLLSLTYSSSEQFQEQIFHVTIKQPEKPKKVWVNPKKLASAKILLKTFTNSPGSSLSTTMFRNREHRRAASSCIPNPNSPQNRIRVWVTPETLTPEKQK